MPKSFGEDKTTNNRGFWAPHRLPARLRHAVNVAVLPWASEPILDAAEAGIPVAVIIRSIRDQDLRDTRRVYGPSHPEVQPHV
mgnify:CR=1 FL=1